MPGDDDTNEGNVYTNESHIALCYEYKKQIDLDGNPVARYNLSGICPSGFVVDENNPTLYATSRAIGLEDSLLMRIYVSFKNRLDSQIRFREE